MATPQIQLDLNQRSWSQRSSRQHCGRKSWGRTKPCRRWWTSTRCSAGVKLARAPGGKPGVPRADRHRQDTRSGDDGPRRCSESRRAAIKINCAEFQHSHEIAKLIGSRPGYLGHRETHPLIKQEVLAKYHSDALKISFLLFDEIEKASDALWQLLLGILDKATLTLGENRRVDLSQTMIFMTSNLGGSEITKLMTGGIGFEPSVRAESKPRLDEKVEKTASQAATCKLAPEFMNRIDKVAVFHPLRIEQFEQIPEIELGMVRQRVLETAKGRFLFRVTPAG